MIYCRKCGKKIPSDSDFCVYCGVKVEMEDEISNTFTENDYNYVNNHEPDNYIASISSSENYSPSFNLSTFYNNDKEEQKSSFKSVIIIIFVVVFFAGLAYIMATGGLIETDTPVSNEPASTSSVSSVPQLTEKERKLNSLYSFTLQNLSESYLKDKMKHPETAKFTFDKNRFESQSAKYTLGGVVEYTNNNGKPVKEAFTVIVLLTENTEGIYQSYDLFIQLGNTNYTNDLDICNSFGIVTKKGGNRYSNLTQGGLLYGDDETPVIIYDVEDILITLDEYNQIQNNMSYMEVVDIIGSLGTQQASAGDGAYATYIYNWDGNGIIGSNASITFQNGKVFAKAQVGLE